MRALWLFMGVLALVTLVGHGSVAWAEAGRAGAGAACRATSLCAEGMGEPVMLAQPDAIMPLAAGASLTRDRPGGAITIVNQADVPVQVGPAGPVIFPPPGFRLQIAATDGPGAEACGLIQGNIVCQAMPPGDIRLAVTVPSVRTPLAAGCTEMPRPQRQTDPAALARLISPQEALVSIWQGQVLIADFAGGGSRTTFYWIGYSPAPGAPNGAGEHGPVPPDGFRVGLIICLSAPGTLAQPG